MVSLRPVRSRLVHSPRIAWGGRNTHGHHTHHFLINQTMLIYLSFRNQTKTVHFKKWENNEKNHGKN